ncbi:hypothetical protein [Lacticaseibacillus absianus]|uniref:hypothetical protein n=1 Tax=Lacticaseibacillus absianus TaxID=2729623 RepID=UPI0015CC50B4|nr:hypothetical protein [Lacticaseibacillus absianus]
MANKHTNHSNAWTWVLLVLAALGFTGFAWFVTQPTDALTMISTGSFGVGLVVLIWLMAYFDDLARGRVTRFAADVLIGAAAVALIYVYMIGFIVYPEFIFGAAGIVLVLAALFALRRPNGTLEDHNRARLTVEDMEDTDE